jgi:DNA polymerase
VEQADVLQEVASQVAVCKNCQLSYSRKKAVPGEGPARAEIMLIGEGPGFYENEQGRPFVGAAGKFLDELLEKAGVSRKEVFITNVVKCRPPGNRDPLPEELQACGGYLDRQIAAINPLIIVTLGRYSMSKFLPNVRISEVHGQPAWVKGRLIIPMFHPAAALHQPSLKTSVERDFARLPEWIQQAKTNSQNAGQPAAGRVAEAAGTFQAGPQLSKPAQSSSPVQAHQESLLLGTEAEQDPEPPKKEEEKPHNDQATQLSLF